MVDPSMPPLTGTVALTSEQIRLLDNGDLKASEVQQAGFAFGTLRCGTDNRNDDNLEFLGLTENDSLACVAYNVAAPVTISKIVEGSTPKGPFAVDRDLRRRRVDELRERLPSTMAKARSSGFRTTPTALLSRRRRAGPTRRHSP